MSEKKILSRLSDTDTWWGLFGCDMVKFVVESAWHGDSEAKMFWTLDESVTLQDLIDEAWRDARAGAAYMSSIIADEEERNKSIQNWLDGLSIIYFEKDGGKWVSTVEKQVDDRVLTGGLDDL